jgi:predicted DNA-binding transcriptional regulator YafY
MPTKMNRIDRISAILTHLQSKKVVTAEELAQRFDTSKRTIYRDIKSLEEGGIPVGAEAGRGFFIAEGFHLPPVMFTKDEAASLIIASKLMAGFSDESIRRPYDSALIKIRSVLRSSEKEYVENIDNSVNVLKYSRVRDDNFPNNFFNQLLQFLAARQRVVIQYFSQSKQEATEREIEPAGFCYYSMNWHLIAWCCLRGDFRDFRLDRIRSVKPTGHTFNEIHFPDLQDFYFKSLIQNNSLIPVTIRVKNQGLMQINGAKYYFGFIKEQRIDEEIVEMEFLSNDLAYLGSWLVTMADNIEIVSPDALLDWIKSFVEKLSVHYLKKS